MFASVADMRSRTGLVIAVLLITASAATLIHWHAEWSGPSCELCHVRNLPALHVPISDRVPVSWISERHALPERPIQELESTIALIPSRAPPTLA